LRGINVGRKNTIKMSDLKNLLEHSGFYNVHTYIQSGNIILQSKKNESNEIKNLVHNLILSDFKINTPVIVLEKSFLSEILNNNPFNKNQNLDSKYIHVTILAKNIDDNDQKVILSENTTKDKLSFGKKCIYLYCPDGYSKTKLTNNFIEKN
jgi:uncharacterized protein (DUF1697 family)